jgi:6-phosphogluconolactonase
MLRLKLLCCLLLITPALFAQSYYLFVGTYTNKGSKGIYVYKFNSTTGKADWVSNTDSIVNPSYLTIAADNRYIYAVTETATNNTGSVSAFEFDSTSGSLQFINKQTSGGANPCYITTDHNNEYAIVANYTGGSLAVLPIGDDGSLRPYSQLIQHQGTSVNAERQEKPHVHSAVFSPDQQYLFAPDLGTDKVTIYNFKPGSRMPLYPANPAYTISPPGNGPRHFTFHPNNKFAYLIEEMSGTVVAYKYNNGKLNLIERVAAHPKSYKGSIGSADIHISPDGKFLYASNRGDENNIAIFAINATTGKLTAKGYQSTLGIKPRNFALDPTGKFLLVANQDTDNIVVFKRNKQTGLLKEAGDQIKVPTPVCLQFMK